QNLSIIINPALSITTSLPQATAGANCQQTITVTGGTKPYATLSVTDFNGGATGLTAAALLANSAAGTVSVHGTPTAPGTVSFTVTVTDGAGSSLVKPYSITINAPPIIGDLSAAAWTVHRSGFSGVM